MINIVCSYCLGLLRDLHSFPTRRSSDLDTTGATTGSGDASSTGGMSTADATSDGSTSIDPGASGDDSTDSGSSTGGTTGDRKSTRLNSSHSQISYAVFCLKKKKT